MGRGVELRLAGACLLKNGHHCAGCVVSGESVWGVQAGRRAAEGGGLGHGLCNLCSKGTCWDSLGWEGEETLFAVAAIQITTVF